MADDFVQMGPDGAGKKLRTQTRTVGANSVHEQYTIVTDETTGNAARVLNAIPGATDYGIVVRQAPVVKTMRTIYAQLITSVATEALIATGSVFSSLGFATAVSGNPFTVTAGKTFRVTSLALAQFNSSAAANWVRVNVRVNTGGAATATSPIAASLMVTGTAALANCGESETITFPEGLDIPAGASVGLSHISNSTLARFDVALTGYEFS